MILVCAATRTEAAACRRGIADARARDMAVLTTGVGPGRAADALARWLRDRAGVEPVERPVLVVSSGFAGALTPGLEPLAWVTASALHRLVGGNAVPVALPPGLLRTADGVTACHIVSAERVLAGEVSGLGSPAVVDMESAALAEIAGAAGLPFLVLRMLTDTPTRPLASFGRRLAAVLGAPDVGRRAAHAARAAAEAACSPVATLSFLREGVRWRGLLREGWRRHASRGLPRSA